MVLQRLCRAQLSEVMMWTTSTSEVTIGGLAAKGRHLGCQNIQAPLRRIGIDAPRRRPRRDATSMQLPCLVVSVNIVNHGRLPEWTWRDTPTNYLPCERTRARFCLRR